MRFFLLSHPPYKTDQELARRNPVELTSDYHVPSVVCDKCGIWASTTTLRVPLPSTRKEFLGLRYLPVDEWKRSRARWARVLGVDPAEINPGATLGPPAGRCRSSIREDVVHPFFGVTWVAPRVRKAITTAKLTGVTFAPVRLSPPRSGARLAELVVHGRAWRQITTRGRPRECKLCGRRDFYSWRDLRVDESRWDGSDFATLDGNPCMVVVTERAAEVFARHQFSNIVVEPITRRSRR